MADLFERLFPASPEDENIAVHYLHAALTDYAAGYTTRQEMINYWSLDASAQADLNALCNALDALGTVVDIVRWLIEFHCVLMFAEAGAKYTTKSAFRDRLGLT